MSNPNRESIDDFDRTLENPYLLAVEMRDLFVYLEGNPLPDADEIMTLLFERDYPYWQAIRAGFLELTDNPGWRYSDRGVQTLAIEVLSADESTVIVQIADERGEQLISDATGQLVKTYDGWDRRVSEFTFQRGDDGAWRYADVTEARSITEDELERMVPVEWTGRS